MKTGQKYFDTIITFLKHTPAQPTKVLWSVLEKEHNINLSQAQVYNIVKRMLSDGVLIKEEWVLSLSMHRLQQLEQFIHEAYVTNSTDLRIPSWSSKTFTASSFAWLDTIRSDISSKLAHITTQDIYYYDPHPYHILGKRGDEPFNLKKFLTWWRTLQYVLWWETFLDKYWWWLLEDLWANVMMKSSDNKIFYASIGNYRYTVEVDSDIMAYFETFFAHTESLDTFNSSLFQKTFHLSWTCTLTLYHDAVKAREIAERIIEWVL